jgi:hypothetical protein
VPDKSTWALVAAAAVAVVTVTAATLVVVNHGTSTSVKKITGTTAQTPGLAWSLDAAQYLGKPFADFSDPRGGASYSSGTPGFLVYGDTLVTIAGVPNDGYTLDEAVMIGVDADDGTVRWKAPAADLQQCSEIPLGGKILCYAINDAYHLVSYDIESGAYTRRTTEESVFGLTTNSDTLYIVEGNAEDNEVRVHSGTFDDVSENWTQSFDIGGSWEVVFGENILTVTDGVGLVKTGGEMAQFDAATGVELWSGRDCIYHANLEAGGVVAQSNTDCDNYDTVSEQILRGPDGKVLATTKSAPVQRPSVEHASRRDTPILLGDSAFDRTTGNRLWTSEDLVYGNEGPLGTLTAVVGDIAYLRDSDSSTGINLRTGKQLWHNNKAETFTPTAADGHMLLGDDGTALTAFDVTSGQVQWTAPFVAIDPDPETFLSGGAGERYGDGWIYSSDRRLIGLAPL